MKKKIRAKNIRVFITFFLFINIFVSIMGYNNVFADGSDARDNAAGMWRQASLWFGEIKTNSHSTISIGVMNEFVDMVNIIGTSVIVLSTIVLGIKYIFGSVEAKADVKESMVTLLVACVFFFGWSSISNILIPDGRLVLTQTTDVSYTNFVGRVFNTGVFIANIAAIIGIIYVGVRYIFSGANGKADLKSKSPYFIIGIILSFSSVSVLTFLSSAINEML